MKVGMMEVHIAYKTAVSTTDTLITIRYRGPSHIPTHTHTHTLDEKYLD